MAHSNPDQVESLKAASAIAQFVPVRFLTGGSSLDETVIRAGSYNEDVLGLTLATVASPGDPVAVAYSGRAKGIAGASLGAGCRVGVGSTNGILIPITASGIASPVPVAAADSLRFVVGRSLVNAAAGDIFTVLLDPEQFI